MNAVFIVDTNVIVSGLLSRSADAPPARILDGMLAAAFAMALSDDLFAEYRSVLNRPVLSKGHGLSMAAVDAMLTDIAEHATMLRPGKAGAAPDPDDQHLWDLLAVHSDLRLITGDKLLRTSTMFKDRIMTPLDFVDFQRWSKQAPG